MRTYGPLEAPAQEEQHEEQDQQQEEELADEDSSAQREQQDDDEKQDKHASSNRSANGAEPYTARASDVTASPGERSAPTPRETWWPRASSPSRRGERR